MSRKQTVLITGATRGIGKAAALRLARRGHRVLATGRDRALLSSLESLVAREGLPLHVSELDVTDASRAEAVVRNAVDDFGRLDALVNNAGYGLSGVMEELTLEEVRQVFETNLFAVLRLSQLVLPHMRQQRSGTIVNVGSVAGQIAVPGEGAYSASKFALHSMTRAMRMETAQHGVRVVLIEPGVIQTDFGANKVWGEDCFREGSPYSAMARQTAVRSKGRELVAQGPENCARRITQVIESRWPSPRYVVGVDARAGALVSRIFPDRLMDFLMRRAVTGL